LFARTRFLATAIVGWKSHRKKIVPYRDWVDNDLLCGVCLEPAGNSGDGTLSIWTPEARHHRTTQTLKAAADAVIHSFRHAFRTRLDETDAGVFDIIEAMDRSSVEIPKREDVSRQLPLHRFN
jgi:hypothetical protein